MHSMLNAEPKTNKKKTYVRPVERLTPARKAETRKTC